MQHKNCSHSAIFTTALRWVTGWTYFSAFWRRLILENKLDPEEAGYIGEKFNHFLPNALGIKPIIEHLVSNPESLWWAMASFTIIEGIVGLLFILGFFTRLMSVGVFMLAMGILLGSGWLGTTCLDEWQIGVLGVATGFTIFLTGSGKYSLDYYLSIKNNTLTQKKWFLWLNSGNLPIREYVLNRIVLLGSVLILALTLYTNQYFHGGVYGTLHNKSVKPHVTITNAKLEEKKLSFTVFRDEGADVYGSFLIGIKLRNAANEVVFEQNQVQLSQLSNSQISNDYVAKVKTGKHSLILPLGARGNLTFEEDIFQNMSGAYTLELIDISGAMWTKEVVKEN
ncbi:TQO small subunit DoxD [Flavobacterium sp. TAB 87]|uniref:TQO small subunit DoxD n=1 Tax=Flavobacterium sp. TAB 87 TaxID=1729581 RepID=UPI00076CC8AE|nr:TQO small subunit DoxD [Flavobacterium sp. TAB 87]KVV15320.1 TQO small subunit DoxD [Flavobacterium sp. TAB 87]